MRLPRECQALRVAAARIPKACPSRRDADQGLPPFPMRIPSPPRPCSHIPAATPNFAVGGTARSNLRTPQCALGGAVGQLTPRRPTPLTGPHQIARMSRRRPTGPQFSRWRARLGERCQRRRTSARIPGSRRAAREPPEQCIKQVSKEAASQHLRRALSPQLATLPLSARCPLLPAVPPPSPLDTPSLSTSPPRTPPPVAPGLAVNVGWRTSP